MSIQSCTTFLQVAYDSAGIKQQMKAVTATQEVIKLGHRHGYAFDTDDLAKASSTFNGAAGSGEARPAEKPRPSTATTFYHHEYELADVPGLAAVIDELPKLKIKPPTVDLAEFDRSFREGDLRSTSRSPADPKFRSWHEGMAKLGWRDPALGPGAPRRDFHLINLDEHVDHPDYDEYFDAKVRIISALEDLFGSEVRFSGSMWYPPASYRLWHTNETQPGWRMYVIDIDEDFHDPADTSFFRYLNPQTGEVVTLRESPKIVRFFKAEQDPSKLFWHCIVNPTVRHRWSFGFVVPEHWMECIRQAA